MDNSPDKNRPGAARSQQESQRDKLARALRENLKRRKAQAKGRKGGIAEDGAPDQPESGVE